jgi:hypothetical protein
MGPSWNFRFIARVLGNPAVMVAGIVSFPWLVSVLVGSNAPPWLILVICVLYAIPILGGVLFRLCRGGEQGTTDITIHQTMTSRTITIGNVPLASTSTELARSLETFRGLIPIPRASGIVHGNPAVFANVEENPQAALPEYVPVTDTPPAPPEGAQGLSVDVHD